MTTTVDARLVHKIRSGSTLGFGDTVAFIGLLNNLSECLPGETPEFFSSAEIIVSRAPGRIDLMGGIADYSGSFVLPFPIANATHVALQLQKEPILRIASVPTDRNDRLRLFEMSLPEFLSSSRPIDYAAAHARFTHEPEHHWAAYVAGAFLVLMRERGCVFKQGACLLISSAVPEGKGV